MTDSDASPAAAAVHGSPLLSRYYDILRGGVDLYGDGREMLLLLADQFAFDGPISGRREGGVGFTHGVRGFIEAAKGIAFLQVVATESGAAVLYDAELPGGTVRFAEFFEFDGDRIRELRIHYNAAEYVERGGR